MIQTSKKIKSECSWIIKYIYFLLCNLKYLFSKKKNIVFIGTPMYDNIGDIGIYIAEKEYMDKQFPNTSVLEISLDMVSKHQKLFRPFIKENLILIIGGGFLGTTWIENEIIVQSIIKNYHNNPIIIMPQTIYYDNTEYGIEELKKSKKIYGDHSNLTICLREDKSYKFALKEFAENDILYIPDSVLGLNVNEVKKDRYGIGLFIRSDKEKAVNFNVYDLVKKQFPDKKIYQADMIGHCKVTKNNRKQLVKNKLIEISGYEFIITDRLHAMIFSTITNTPVIAFDNKTCKVSGVYKKIKNHSYVQFTDGTIVDFSKKLDNIKDLLNDLKYNKFDNTKYQKEYEILTLKIKNILK